MSLPLETTVPSDQPISGDTSSTGFMVLLGAIAGGSPQLILPTATMLELIGNTVMGAILVGTLDLILLRRTLPGHQLRRGRVLLLVAVSAALAMVTYRGPGYVFQQTFGIAPPQGVRALAASSFTAGRIGNIGHRLRLYAEPVALQQMQEGIAAAMQRRATQADLATGGSTGDGGATLTEYDPAGPVSWNDFVARHMPPGSPLTEAARQFTKPQGFIWTTPARSGATVRTLLLRDTADNLTLVEHVPG